MPTTGCSKRRARRRHHPSSSQTRAVSGYRALDDAAAPISGINWTPSAKPGLEVWPDHFVRS
eukprot:214562-Chlamydomonas_euryale.AAC.3